MTRILHLSDPHFGTERPQVINALRRLAGELAPNCLVLSGDITQRARPSQFKAARNFVDSLAVHRVLAIPGNHDIALFNPFKRVFFPYRDYRKHFGATESVIDEPGMLITGVNTTRRYRHIHGEVSASQIDGVANRLRQASAAQLRIVVTHQPAWVVREQDEVNRLRGNEAALRAWSGAGADLVLGGHIHQPYVAPMHEHLAGLQRPLWVVQAGTAVSSRLRAEADNSVNLIEHRASMNICTITRWDYRPATDAFAAVHETTLRLAR